MILKRPLYLVSNFSFCNSKNIVLFIHLFNCPYDESTVSLPDDVDSSDEELSDPSNLDYLERPISHYYDEDELFGCKLPKPQRSNGILKKGGVHLHKQVHLRSLNCLDDSVEFATPPSAPPIIDADFPPQLERFSKGSPMNEQNDSWPSRESVAGRSECSIEQKPSNVKATTDFAQRLDRTITEDTERPHLAYYNTSSCNSQYAWQTLITYDACICLCLQAWARGCTEAPEFLKDECLALRSAFGWVTFHFKIYASVPSSFALNHLSCPLNSIDCMTSCCNLEV
ncbi:uncharacterized protein [Arachis hypogaea]|uniref:uncharacterized protein isoform X3 n=1 Tax=Arachis hypogaea TaxID=3818 RepID=UPI003B20C866